MTRARLLWLTIFSMVLPFSAMAAEAAAVVAPAVEAQSTFMTVILGLVGTVGTVVLGFLANFLKNWGAVKKADATEAKAAGRRSLKLEALAALARVASNLAAKEVVALTAANADGKIDKDELKKLGTLALSTVGTEFLAQGVDLGKELGPDFLEQGLRYVVDRFKKTDKADPATELGE